MILPVWTGCRLSWNDVDMKVLMSQTPFSAAATHHGQYDAFLYGDLDAGGWPKQSRDRTVKMMRKGFAFHVTGDQHLTSIIQYGTDDFRDAGYSFCPPAIATGYSRWFRPDELDIPVQNRPAHGSLNTGEYADAFTIRLGYPEHDNWKTIENLQGSSNKDKEDLQFFFSWHNFNSINL